MTEHTVDATAEEIGAELVQRNLPRGPANHRYAGGPPHFDAYEGRWYVPDRNGVHIRWARVLMMGELGRELLPDEHVHHVNGDCTDDSIENLKVVDIREHAAHHGREAWKQRKAAWPHAWSAEHPCCVSCGTTERKHQAHGLCLRCDARERARRYRAARKAAA
jgi:hypothetical protein